MTTNYASKAAKHAESFEQLSTDDKLAVLWRVYGFIRSESSMDSPNENVAQDSSDSLFEQTKGLSQDKQLQAMRDILDGADSPIVQDYNDLSNTTKIAFWYQLAQGMERSDIVTMPSDYQLSEEAQTLANQLEPIGFEQQYVFMRDALL